MVSAKRSSKSEKSAAREIALGLEDGPGLQQELMKLNSRVSRMRREEGEHVMDPGKVHEISKKHMVSTSLVWRALDAIAQTETESGISPQPGSCGCGCSLTDSMLRKAALESPDLVGELAKHCGGPESPARIYSELKKMTSPKADLLFEEGRNMLKELGEGSCDDPRLQTAGRALDVLEKYESELFRESRLSGSISPKTVGDYLIAAHTVCSPPRKHRLDAVRMLIANDPSHVFDPACLGAIRKSLLGEFKDNLKGLGVPQQKLSTLSDDGLPELEGIRRRERSESVPASTSRTQRQMLFFGKVDKLVDSVPASRTRRRCKTVLTALKVSENSLKDLDPDSIEDSDVEDARDEAEKHLHSHIEKFGQDGLYFALDTLGGYHHTSVSKLRTLRKILLDDVKENLRSLGVSPGDMDFMKPEALD